MTVTESTEDLDAGKTLDAAFPMRAAALDVGSNAIRYSIAEFSDAHRFVEIESQRVSVRLGHDAFTTGVLSAKALDDAVMAVATFRRRIDELGVRRYRAVATSAIRESRNGNELVARVRDECGIDLETISGSEEARLVWVGVQHRMRLADGPWVLADLGGGSIEVTIVHNGNIVASESQPLGTVRLIESLPNEDSAPVEFRTLLRSEASRVALPAELPGRPAATILTGGSADCLADLIAPGSAPGAILETTRATLNEVLVKLSGMTIRERIEKLGMRQDRADVVVPAGVIYDRVADLAGTERFLIPRVGVKDGLLLDLAIDYAEHGRHEGEIDRLTRSAAISLGQRLRFDEEHARHVADLSLALFDQLIGIHGLSDLSRRRLETAALLHDVGQVISYRRHHKHSWYIIRNSELPGLAAEDIRLVALTARYHRRGVPRDGHEDYSSLRESEKEEVRKLAAIVRVADALDHDRSRRVQALRAEVDADTVRLHLSPGEDTVVERWALGRTGGLFDKVFRRRITIA